MVIGKKVDALFCGLLRKEEMFRKSILDLNSLRKKGIVDKIIFSTWKGEMAKNPGMIEFLKQNDVKVIESEEPKIAGHGHIWCQMKSLEEGLKEIEPDKFVLKSRTDVYINPEFLYKIFTQKEKMLKIKKSLPKGDKFYYKIWIHYYELKTPFHMAEECFFAHHHDAKLLVNYDSSYDTKYNIGGGITHIRRFIHPFVNDYEILQDYLKRHSKNSFVKSLAIKFSKKFFEIRSFKLSRRISERDKFKNLRKKLENDEFIACLAAYYSILHSHFYIDNRSFENQVTFREASEAKIKLDSYDIEKNFSEEKTYMPHTGQIYGYDEELLDNIFNNKIKETPFSQKLLKAIGEFNNLSS